MPEKKTTFVVHSAFGEISDLAYRLQSEGHEVFLHIPESNYAKVYDGLVPKVKDWYRCIGEGYVWVFDGCDHGDLQDWLRERGELVFGGSKLGDKLENDRQAGQAWFKKIGFDQPQSQNFKDIEGAIAFIKEHADKRWILKQSGDLPKSVNHMAKFDDNSDLIYHLEDLKKKWSEHEMGGPFEADLMEIVEGLEVAASAVFNGTDFLRNPDGSICGWINWEEKKEANGGTGETCGEMGTTFYGCTKKSAMMDLILGSPEVVKMLKKAKFRGCFDINGALKKDGKFVGFEPTCRFGVPSTSYELIESLESNLGDLIANVAAGKPVEMKIKKGWGMVMVVAAKPFPTEGTIDDEATSVGEILWPLKDGKPVPEFDEKQMKRIHLYNFYKNKDGRLEVPTKSGYLLTVTDVGSSIADVRDKLIAFIKNSVYISGMKYRTDIGQRVEEAKVKSV